MSLILVYLKEMINFMVIGWVFYILIRLIIIMVKKINIVWRREIIMSIFVAYIIGLFSQTILPNWVFGIDSFTGEIIFDMHFSNDLSTVNLIPFASLFHYLYITNDAVSNWDSVSKLNILANLLLFFPMGFLLPLIWKNLRSFKIVITLGFIFVTTIEVIQAFIGRSSDIDDVILNVSSIAIGYGVFICVNHFLKRGKIK